MMLKADLHIHTNADPYEPQISYSPKDMIDLGASKGYEVLAFTHHENVGYTKEWAAYAKKKGILLLPGIEVNFKGKHVVVLGLEKVNPRPSLSELKEMKKKGAVIFAPHPFYPRKDCLRDVLVKNVSLFDAVEHSHFYCDWFTNMFNRKAIRFAKKYDKPIVGTSDAHFLYQFGRTFTLIDAKKNKRSVLDAIKKGKVKYVTRPLPLFILLRHVLFMFRCYIKRKL